MTSPDDLIDDDFERYRLNNYIDWGGIKNFEEFKHRVKQAFDTPTGRPFKKSLSDAKLRSWYNKESSLISRFAQDKPVPVQERKSERRFYLGFINEKAVGIVRQETVIFKRGAREGQSQIKFRASNGQFAKVEKPDAQREKSGRFASKYEPPMQTRDIE